MATIKRIRLTEEETSALTEAATKILAEYPLISPLDLFDKAQVKALTPDRRRERKRLQKCRASLYKWLYDSVIITKKTTTKPEEKPVANSRKSSAKVHVKNHDLSEQELIEEFVRHLAPEPGESTETRFQMIEDRLQGIERLLGALTGAMRQVINQKKAVKGS